MILTHLITFFLNIGSSAPVVTVAPAFVNYNRLVGSEDVCGF